MSEPQPRRRGELVNANTLILPTYPDVVRNEILDYMDTARPVPKDVAEDELFKRIDTFSTKLDYLSHILIKPIQSKAAYTVPPAQLADAYRTYMVVVLMAAETMVDKMVEELYRKLDNITVDNIDDFIETYKKFHENIDSLYNSIMLVAREIYNILCRNLPPELRSHISIESIGRMIINLRKGGGQ